MFSKKHRFFVLKKKYFVLVVCLLLVMASAVVYFTAIKPTFRPNTQKVIVIDAGHGGLDVKLGRWESEKKKHIM